MKIFAADPEEGLPFGGFFLIFQNVFNDGEGQEIIVLELLDHGDAVDIALVIVRDIAAPLARFGQKAFADIIMYGLFAYIRAPHEVSDFHGSIPRKESFLRAIIQTGFLSQVKRQGH